MDGYRTHYSILRPLRSSGASYLALFDLPIGLCRIRCREPVSPTQGALGKAIITTHVTGLGQIPSGNQ
ncbi:hypothetical protein E6P09_18505 (plasmid) [Haloferax mediterranei ATCC 33500]|uniref:Uncharacterized protein n=1 Tax=Haloferax mediterranei (strain ATCC 33500 / DSM 1411 / JCM 8866 / NBRC 14739 / NCIMB 2177 / R-4) TaxID=523841 RepID=A0A4P8P9I1_HALMT|nr:hypothetical protein [Haloferax mediterranei]MDX5989860.1 hypothetical protein [Haloferax mediterranei ATCC 33500]QCQ77301.1 hypothetical protein E6P09_18505 [Haloferax mediterranei ATCC 33500]